MMLEVLQKVNVEVGDEVAFIKYAEAFIYFAQDLLRKKDGLTEEAVLGVCEMVSNE